MAQSLWCSTGKNKLQPLLEKRPDLMSRIEEAIDCHQIFGSGQHLVFAPSFLSSAFSLRSFAIFIVGVQIEESNLEIPVLFGNKD